MPARWNAEDKQHISFIDPKGLMRIRPDDLKIEFYKMLIDLNQQAGNMYKLPSLSFRGRSPWESPAPQYRLAASQLTM